MEDTVKVTGQLLIEMFDLDGNVVDRREVKNLVLTAGKAFIANNLRSPVLTTTSYSSGVSTFTVASPTGIVNGMLVSGPGIPANTYCTISGSVVSLLSIATGSTATTTGTYATHNVTFQTAPVSFIEVGASTSPSTPAVGDLALNVPLSPRRILPIVGGTTSGSSNTINFTTTFSAAEVVGTITEAGLWTALTGGTLVARTTFPGVVKAATNPLTVSWNITIS